MLEIYDTLDGKKKRFKPLKAGTVRMYVCGVTVYDECHLGHARSALVFETIRRYLKYCGFRVIFVKNFTDVDDKIINRAKELGIRWQEVTGRYIKAYYRDMKRLGITRATKEPKATGHMSDIIKLTQTLIKKGKAYQVNGDVYFQVEKFPAYGKLSKRKLEDMQAGARVEVDERKRHPMDFALWKGAKPGEPAWKSPWGPGRPGWHIECSAMAMKYLGKTFDIHGGGADLIFPHHENEIAQSCAATGKKEFALYWLHNGFVQVNQEKMSKSLGNFFTIREIFEKWTYPEPVTAEVLRYFLISTHYRSPLDFSDHALRGAKRTLDGFYGLFQRLEESSGSHGAKDAEVARAIETVSKQFNESMDNDFSTPVTISAFQYLRTEANRLLEAGLSRKASGSVLKTFQSLGSVIGLFQLSVKDWQFGGHDKEEGGDAPTLGDKEIEQLIAERSEARKLRDFARADEIRKSLAEKGITLEDRPDGTTRWKR
jgi:cysteinyl-tRNA synthetase